jgi:hypothetical protein
VNARERGRVRRRLLVGLRRVIAAGGHVAADVRHPASLPLRARRSNDPLINQLPIAFLCVAQGELIAAGQVERVVVGRTVLLRPVDGWAAPVISLASRRTQHPGGPT